MVEVVLHQGQLAEKVVVAELVVMEELDQVELAQTYQNSLGSIGFSGAKLFRGMGHAPCCAIAARCFAVP